MTKHNFSILSLGDSYTIGEGVALYESFPCQAVQELRKKGLHFAAPEIIAKTGWTTFELAEAILHHHLQEHYDFVTLLIGVNNQYRNLPAREYEADFEFLLRKAIHFAGGKNERVVVFSIPDWGVTPFAGKHNKEKIAKEIDGFNAANKGLAEKYKVKYIDITPASREVMETPGSLTHDGLHYAAAVYKTWAQSLADYCARYAR